MAHNVMERDGLFTVREPAWHGLGVVLSDYPTREEAQAIAHPWEPVTTPLYRKVPIVTEFDENGNRYSNGPQLEEVYEEVTDHVGVERSDTGHMLGVVTSSLGENLVHNSEMYDIAEAIEGEARGSVQFETGGSLKNGRKVWLLIRLKDPLVIGKDPGTATIPYYSLQNAHDGSAAFRGQATMTRIVCDNTAQMADLDAQARGTEFAFRHTSSIHERIDEAKAALAGWRESVGKYLALSNHLVELRVNREQREEYIERFIPMPPPHTVSERVVNNVERAQQDMRDILDGPTCSEIAHTAYGLLQASVEYVEHYRRANTQESRFKRAYLDRSKIIADALELSQEVAL